MRTGAPPFLWTGWPRSSGWVTDGGSRIQGVNEIQMVLGTANLTVEMAVGSQLSATVSEGDL